MRRFLALALLLALAGCGGGTSNTPAPGGPSGPDGNLPPDTSGAGSARLSLSAEPDGALWRVNLRAEDARDLYQLAGTLSYDSGAYTVQAVEAGGGLGQPDSSLFGSSERTPGRIDFAYTKRFHGAGASGELLLLSLIVQPQVGRAEASDFTLETADGALRCRDSRRRDMSIEVEAAR